MAWLTSFLVSAGLSDRRARQLAIGLVLILLIIGVWIAKLIYDRRVIANHEAGSAAVQAQADRAADAAAATVRRTDDARLQAEAEALEKVTENAIKSDIGAARRAYYDCVRLQQQARSAGRLAPAC
ncbi:hypothetical protein [Sphingobium yanoikuyae]|uniref:Uncharacterized protein n=1 Tax=Sphingobium yanoikuyae TaxID=13690 RepID=A0A430BWT2_SPHYA|nr:hypothetical protein [Sphingobium yanoikuyae]RSU57214.1 hypothetical protein DAH51_10400 [Sphingobium yanoikuyae]